jgi:hypothetical protein
VRGRRFDFRASLSACGLVQPYGGKVSTAVGLYLNPDATKRHGPICTMQTDTHDPSSLRAGAHARERAFFCAQEVFLWRAGLVITARRFAVVPANREQQTSSTRSGPTARRTDAYPNYSEVRVYWSFPWFPQAQWPRKTLYHTGEG